MAGLRRRAPEPPPPPITDGRRLPALTASAAQIQLDTDQIFRLRTNDQEWQNESWRHYDICGELRFVANRHSAALSRAKLYIADVDEQGAILGPTKDPDMAVLAETVFGSQAQKAEIIRSIGVNLYIAGECYAVAIGSNDPDNDKWFVVSRKEMRKHGGSLQVKMPLEYGGDWYTLKQGSDLLIRIWTPHPRLKDVADSPTRAVLPTLREIERLTMLAFSQIDSRLISAGLLLMPQGIDFPHGEDEAGGIQGLAERILEAAKAQLSGAGTAAGLVPIMAEVPIDVEGRGNVGNSFAHIKFDTPLTAELEKKLDQAIRRLALGLDVAPEDLLGQGDANHWSGWQVEESSIKIFTEPALVRMCAGLNVGYLAGAAKAKKKDPTRFSFWYDTSALVVRPNRQQDAISLHELDVLSDEAVRAAGAWDDADRPNTKELLTRRTWELVKLNPALIADEQIAKILGFPSGIQVPGGMGQPPPGGMGEDLTGQDQSGQQQLPDAGSDQRSLPAEPTTQESPAQQLTASAAMVQPGAEQIVLRALELAGGRLLDRTHRGQFATVPRYELHTRLKARDRMHAQELMRGAWEHVPRLADSYRVDPDELRSLLSGYCAELLVHGYAHSSSLLTEVLDRAKMRVLAAT